MSLPAPPFVLDPFQQAACDALDAGSSVVVAAPTGAGKTVVAEHAIALALGKGAKAFYTAPVKALSNQKYRDLEVGLGRGSVGLLTGDNSRFPEAGVVVMTTEVLRNMIYAGAPLLDGLRWVILDEVHYLDDPYRGPVWEEIIVHLDQKVGLVCLSATVSNAAELAAWIRSVRGATELVVEEHRPVPLRHHYLVAERDSNRLHDLPTVVRGRRPNPDGSRFDAPTNPGQRRGGQRTRWVPPRRRDVIEHLRQRGQLPAIYFIFSRAGCDDAARALTETGIRLTSGPDRRRIRSILDEHLAGLDQGDLDALGEQAWRDSLLAGIAVHHAGLVPPFKEAAEACFVEGLVQVVFATETLALGINMPARSVVVERLTKFGGDSHALLTAAQYTQLAGRAGRRGIDEVGHAHVLWSPWVRFEEAAELARSRSFELRSAFRPSYNMAANLVQGHDRSAARELLRASFGQFQIGRRLDDLDEQADGLRIQIRELSRRSTGTPADRGRQRGRARGSRTHRLATLRRRLEVVEAERDEGTASLVRHFDRILAVLEEWGYVRGWKLTGRGQVLARLYHECDLLVAEAIHRGLLDDLPPPDVAGVLSCLVYEHRGGDEPPPPRYPHRRLRSVGHRLEELWEELAGLEQGHRLPPTRRPDAGFMAMAQGWAAGGDLDEILDEELVTGGDFVRLCKQLIDLLGQVGVVARESGTRSAAAGGGRGPAAGHRGCLLPGRGRTPGRNRARRAGR